MSVINTNITSMIGQQNLNKSQSALQTSMERLSSGLRINSAKDDAAGQAIANRMSAQITGLATAQRNANDGISVAQTAEGALNQVNDNLQRIRELSVQAQNGTNSDSDLESIQNEIGQRLNEINRISEETDFNGVKVLQEDSDLQIQVGANDGEAISIALKKIDAATLNVSNFSVSGLDSSSLSAVSGNAGSATTTTTESVSPFVLANSYTGASPTDPANTATGVVSYTATDGAQTVAVDFVNSGGDEPSGTEGLVEYTDSNGETAYAIVNDTTTPTSAEAATIASDGTITRGAALSGADLTTATDTGSTTAIADTDNVTSYTATETRYAVKADVDGDNTSEFYEATQNTDGSYSWDSYNTNDVTAAVTAGSPQAVTESTTTTAVAGIDGTANSNVSDVVGSGTVYKRNDVDPNDLENAYAVLGDDGNYYAATVDTTSGAVTAGTEIVSDGNVDTAGTNEIVTARSAVDVQADVYHNPLPEATGNVFAKSDGNGFVVETTVLQQDGSSATKYFEGTADADGNVSWDSSTGEVDLGNVTTGTALSQVDYTSTTTTADVDFTGVEAGDELVSYADEDGNTQYMVKTTDSSGNASYFAAEVDLEATSATFGAVTYDKTDAETQVAVKSDDPLKNVDDALKTVDALRSDLGAIQNRFESAITNLSTTETNLSAARSRIEDADYAVEVANMTRAQILQQAGTSVLAQANQIPQNVLSLLG